MPSINLSPPVAPAVMTGLSPGVASPVAPTDGVAPGAFSTVIAGLGEGFTLDAPKPPSIFPGTVLQPERPILAAAPQPLPPVEVEDVMVGSGLVPTLPDVPKLPANPPLTTPPEAPVEGPASDPGLVTCGLQILSLNGPAKLTLPRGAVRPLPAPVRMPPDEVPDMPAADPASDPVRAIKKSFEGPMPAILADTLPSLPVPPPFAFAPAAENVPSPLPSSTAEAPSSGSNNPAGAVAAPASPPFTDPKGNPEPQQLPPAPVVTSAATPQAHGFTLPPEVARQIAQLVQSAVGEPAEHARDTPPALDTAILANAPVPQVQAQGPAPLHASFEPTHRPAIDTGRAEWMQSMIERIAEMPQVDNKREAQIRLLPDALGPVSVKVEQRDDRVHVTLHAENAQTRQLLTDAAPRLQEIAEARGIRLTQASIGGGESHDRRSAPDHQQPAPLRPRPVKADADPETETAGDLIA